MHRENCDYAWFMQRFNARACLTLSKPTGPSELLTIFEIAMTAVTLAVRTSYIYHEIKKSICK